MIARMRELALVRLSGEKGEEEGRGDWIILVGLCLFVIIIRVFHFIRRCIVFMRLITGTTNGSRKIFLTRNNDNYKTNNFKVFSNVILELIPEARFFQSKYSNPPKYKASKTGEAIRPLNPGLAYGCRSYPSS